MSMTQQTSANEQGTVTLVKVNGAESQQSFAPTTRVTEMVELVKAVLDPEHMITAIGVDGRELEEHEWASPLSAFPGSCFELTTGKSSEYIADRLSIAPEVISSCYMEFRDARKKFHAGDQAEGNRSLVQAVSTTRNFFAWFATLSDLMEAPQRAKFNIDSQVREISDVCKRICQQQLYQSWWAIGETIQRELEPKLDSLEDHIRKIILAK
jgi:hypothetical protein